MIYCTKSICKCLFSTTLAFFLLIGVCSAQRPITREHNIKLGLGLSGGRSVLLDHTISALTFSGFYGGISAKAVIERNNKEEHILYLTVRSGKSTKSSFYKNEIRMVSTELNYAYLLEWFSFAGTYRFSLKSGFDISLLYNNRNYQGYINRKKTFEYNASIGTVVKAVFALNNKPESWTIGNKLVFNPLSFLIEPAFERETISGSIQENRNNNSFFKSGRIIGPASFFHLNNELLLQKPISKSSTVSVAYLWNFWRINGNREVKQGSHLFEFGCLLKF